MDLLVNARFNAPPALAFKALTSPDGLDQFWTERSRVEETPGGRFEFWYEDAAAPDPDAWGTFLRFLPGQMVQLAFGEGDESPVTVTFEGDARGGTKVVLVQENLDDSDEEALEELYDGWEEVLAGAREVAERWHAKAQREANAAKGGKGAKNARTARGRRR